MYDVIIIGAGTAGLTAAMYACRSGCDVLVLESTIYGGQIINTPDVENFPAVDPISGAEFAMQLYNQADRFGAELRFEQVLECRLTDEIKTVVTDSGTYETKNVIIANGAQHRKLGCEGEEEFSGRGVSYCATCDGSFYKGKEVAVIGGGNTALEDALYLSKLCKKVHLIHRRDEFRGDKTYVEKIMDCNNIAIHYDSITLQICGEGSVNGLIIENKHTKKQTRLDLDGVFVCIGMQPHNELFASQLTLDESGYLVAGEDCETGIPGVYAAGDTRTKPLRQLVTAAADGAVAASRAAARI